jgi:hypothetical protein
MDIKYGMASSGRLSACRLSLSVLKSLWYRIIEFGKMNAMMEDFMIDLLLVDASMNDQDFRNIY